MKKSKVLLIQSSIKHYRVPVFNRLAEHVDLTIMYDSGVVPEGADFKTIKVNTKKFKHFRKIHMCNIVKLTKSFDAVIMMLDPSYLTTHLLVNLKCCKPVILWGIGVAATRDVRYDSCPKTTQVLLKLIKRATAAVFYSDYPKKKYENMGIPSEKMFVANNTVEVLPIEKQEKDTILFIGSLYKQKKIFELLQNYYNAYCKNNTVPKLVIVGDGEEYKAVKEWILQHKLDKKIELAGAVFEDTILCKYFSRAIACISPDQAGLSVLKSFGYGVPFVSHKDAITGGERFNITHGKTGVFVNDFNEIEEIVLECAEDKEKYLAMGRNAHEHYLQNRTVPQMVDGFVNAIEYVCSCR